MLSSANDIVADIESRVSTGALGPGDRLPPVRAVANQLSLSPTTVAAAYRKLRERGVVVGRGRQGTSIAHRTTITVTPAPPLPHGMVDAMAGNPDASLLPRLGPALKAAASAPPAIYGDRLVVQELSDAARAWLTADDIDATNLTVTSGGMDAIERVLNEYLRPGDRVGVEDPGHPPVHRLVSAMGLEAIPIRLDSEGILPVELDQAITAGIRALIVTPRAQNPVGAAISPRRALELDCLLAPHQSLLVIEDDHAGPVSGVVLAGLNRDRPAWAVIRAVSKSLGPDLRLAFVAGDERTIDGIEARLTIGPGWVSHILQRTVAHLLSDPESEALINNAADRYRHNREQLISRLGAAGIGADGASGLQVWIPVANEQPILDALRNAGFALRGGADYRVNSPPAVRITIAALDDAQIARIAEALISILGRRLNPTTRLS